jgi:hypothetical protein
MTDHDMTDALKHPHPLGMKQSHLTRLAAISKNKFNKHLAPVIIDSPVQAAENKPIGTCPSNNNIPNQAQLSNQITNRSG